MKAKVSVHTRKSRSIREPREDYGELILRKENIHRFEITVQVLTAHVPKCSQGLDAVLHLYANDLAGYAVSAV